MKRPRRFGIALIVVCLIIVWQYYDLQKDPYPLYIPGRDTIKQWNDGVCEIVGTVEDGLNIVNIRKRRITDINNFVKAYKKIDNQVFFIMTRGYMIVDLDTEEYEIFDSIDSLDATYTAIFSNPESFTSILTKG